MCLSLCLPQAHGASVLSSFCEGFFLQHMAGLLEREAFRSLLLGPLGARWVTEMGSGPKMVPPRGDSPLEELEMTLARRLRSLYITSRV